MLILQWKKVKSKGRSALMIELLVAKIRSEFQLKTVDPTSSTNFFTHLVVPPATVVQTEYETKNSRKKEIHKLILRYTYLRDFAKSSFL